METDMLKGKLVRLVADDPAMAVEAFGRWGANSEYQRLCSTDYALQYSTKKWKEWLEKDEEKDPPPGNFFFIHALEDDRLIGGISLDGGAYPSGETFVGIGIGDPADWGKGYGTDAMNVILRYAFEEMNLRRVALDRFGASAPADRLYKEGRYNEAIKTALRKKEANK